MLSRRMVRPEIPRAMHTTSDPSFPAFHLLFFSFITLFGLSSPPSPSSLDLAAYLQKQESRAVAARHGGGASFPLPYRLVLLRVPAMLPKQGQQQPSMQAQLTPEA